MKRCIGLFLTAGLVLSAQPPARLVKSELLPVTDATPEDPAVAKVLAPLTAQLNASFGQVLVVCPSGVFRGRKGEENRLGYWVADLMRRKAAAMTGLPVRFAITNSGGLRQNLRPGPVKVGDIFEVMPFDNELVLAAYTGAEILQMVKEGILRRGGEPMSGVAVKLAGTPEQPELSITWDDGKPIDPAAEVWVALTDYLLASGDSMSTIRKGRRPIVTGQMLRQLLLDECLRLGRLKGQLIAPAGGRYAFTPEMALALQERRIRW